MASLQGQTAQEKLAAYEVPDAIVYLANGEILFKSDAVIAIGQRLGGLSRIAATCLRLIPKFLRDSVYDFIARHRYRVFAQKSHCRIPTEEEKRYFLS